MFSNTALSYPDYCDYRDGNRSFEGLVAASITSFGFKPDAAVFPKVTFGMYISGNFFRVLGVQPALGRGFLDSEDQAVGRDAPGSISSSNRRCSFRWRCRRGSMGPTVSSGAISAR